MAFISDTFTDVDGTLLSAHTGETNATYALHPASAATSEIIGQSRICNSEPGTVTSTYYNNHASGGPATADYEVEGVVFQDAALNASSRVGVLGRLDTVADTFYTARFLGTGNWQLYKVVATVATQLGSDVADTIGIGSSKTVKLKMVGDQISLYVNGVLTIGPITDSAITAAGKVGVRLTRQELHIDSLTAADSGPDVFVSDSFTDTSGTGLGTHIGETGADWTEHTSYSSGDVVISDANRLRSNSANVSCYWADGVPASADYEVEGVIRCLSAIASSLGVAGRIDTTADTFYFARYNATVPAWQLYKVVAGANTQLGSDYVDTLSATNERTLKLELVGSQIKMFVQGVERVAVTDSAITAAGKAGVRSSVDAATDSTGFHLNYLTATDLTAVAGGGGAGNRMLLGVG